MKTQDLNLKQLEVEIKKNDLLLKTQELLFKKAEYERYVSEESYINNTFNLILMERRLDLLNTLCSLATLTYDEPNWRLVYKPVHFTGTNSIRYTIIQRQIN